MFGAVKLNPRRSHSGGEENAHIAGEVAMSSKKNPMYAQKVDEEATGEVSFRMRSQVVLRTCFLLSQHSKLVRLYGLMQSRDQPSAALWGGLTESALCHFSMQATRSSTSIALSSQQFVLPEGQGLQGRGYDEPPNYRIPYLTLPSL